MKSPRRWFYEMLSRGEPPTVPDDEVVEAGFVSLVAGQLVLARLEDLGITASAFEARLNPYQPIPMAHVMCRAHDAERVRGIIDEVTTGRGPATAPSEPLVRWGCVSGWGRRRRGGRERRGRCAGR